MHGRWRAHQTHSTCALSDYGGHGAKSAPLPTLLFDLPCLFREHDRDAVADRVGEFGGARDQFLPCAVEFQRPLGQRTDQDFQKLWIDAAVGALGRGIHTVLRIVNRRAGKGASGAVPTIEMVQWWARVGTAPDAFASDAFAHPTAVAYLSQRHPDQFFQHGL